MDWHFLSHQSMMLICSCLTSLGFQRISGSVWKMRCLRDIRSLEGASVGAMSPLGHPVCPGQRSCCLSQGSQACLSLWVLHSFLLQPSCFSLANAYPRTKQSWDLWVFLPPSGEHGHVGASLPLPVREHGHSHSLSFCPCLHPVAALPSAACSRMSAWSKNDLQQLLCLTALGRSCHSRSINIWSISCLVVTVLEEYKLLWKITLK